MHDVPTERILINFPSIQPIANEGQIPRQFEQLSAYLLFYPDTNTIKI